jgi:hypothetical protein
VKVGRKNWSSSLRVLCFEGTQIKIDLLPKGQNPLSYYLTLGLVLVIK